MEQPEVEKPVVERNMDEQAASDALFLQNQRVSPFLRLPAELCNKIYVLVLGSGQSIRPLDPVAMYRIMPGKRDWTYPRGQLALLEICRQIHFEAHLFPFTLNEFSRLPRDEDFTEPQANAISAIRAHAHELRILVEEIPDLRMKSTQPYLATTVRALGRFRGLRHITVVCIFRGKPGQHYRSFKEELKHVVEWEFERVGCAVDVDVDVDVKTLWSAFTE